MTDGTFEVEAILQKKVFNGKTLYLVKWKDFGIEEATWESVKVLQGAKDLIKKFKRENRRTYLNMKDLNNVQEEQDDDHTVVRDTFKKKRGRPSKKSSTSRSPDMDYKAEDHQDDQGEKIIQAPRKRGRPRKIRSQMIKDTSFDTNRELEHQERNYLPDDYGLTNEDESYSFQQSKQSETGAGTELKKRSLRPKSTTKKQHGEHHQQELIEQEQDDQIYDNQAYVSGCNDSEKDEPDLNPYQDQPQAQSLLPTLSKHPLSHDHLSSAINTNGHANTTINAYTSVTSERVKLLKIYYLESTKRGNVYLMEYVHLNGISKAQKIRMKKVTFQELLTYFQPKNNKMVNSEGFENWYSNFLVFAKFTEKALLQQKGGLV